MSRRTPIRVASLAPEHIRGRYMRGGCFDLAKVLSKQTRLPIWGLFHGSVEGDLHHAFVADEARGLAFDIRGTVPFADVAKGSVAEDDPVLAPLSEERILQEIFSWDPDELKEARRVVKSMLRIREDVSLSLSASPVVAAPAPEPDDSPTP